MYSALCDKRNRYFCSCLLNNVTVVRVETVIDTGAYYTCYTADTLNSLLSDEITEKMFKNAPFIELHGFVETMPVRFYKYHLRQYTIGTIDLGSQDVWITFDKRVKNNLVGMDILKQLYFVHEPENKRIVLFKDKYEYFSYNHPAITRKCYVKADGTCYVTVTNTTCSFSQSAINRDNNGPYVMINAEKCYLQFS